MSQLGGGRATAEVGLKRPAHRFWRGFGLGQPVGHGLSPAQRPLSVGQQQCLKRRGGGRAGRARTEALGKVEGRQHRIRGVAQFLHEDTAAGRTPVYRSGQPSDEQLATRHQHGVADLLRVEPLGREAPEEAIGWVHREFAFAGLPTGGLAIGGGCQNEAMNVLHLPAALHKTGRQPIEQLWVGGRLSQGAEVVRRRHQSSPEVMLPDPVRDDAGRERIGRLRDPVRQSKTPSCGGSGRRDDLRGSGIHNGRERGFDHGAAPSVLQQHRRCHRAAVCGDKSLGQRLGLEGIKLREPRFQGRETFRVGSFDRLLIEALPLVIRLDLHEFDELLLGRRPLGAGLGDHGLDILREHLAIGLLSFEDARLPDRVNLRPNVLGGSFPLRQRLSVSLLLRCRGARDIESPGDPSEEGLHRVIVFLEKGIKLVIVALGAAQP